tara:strand:- start:309 stop:1016 length:708 start_codon:yes stop_codon:yes gene_type:complete
MNLFYSTHIDINKKRITLEDQENRHLVKVLRKNKGDLVKVTDGVGNIYDCNIIEINKNSTNLNINNSKQIKLISPSLKIGICLTKKTERFEWFLEKATEIGVAEITPIISQYSEKTNLNFNRSYKIMISAMKQSLRFHLPKLNKPTNFTQFIEIKYKHKNNFIASCKNNNLKLFQKIIKKSQDVNILIGPEGGFSEFEIDLAKKANFTPVSLGENRLRTETAGLASCMIFSFVNN